MVEFYNDDVEFNTNYKYYLIIFWVLIVLFGLNKFLSIT